MDGIAGAVNAMEGAFGPAVALSCVVAVVGKHFAGSEGGLFADDALPLKDVLVPIFAFNHPAPSVQADRRVREVGDGDEIDERVRRIAFERIGVAKVDEAI